MSFLQVDLLCEPSVDGCGGIPAGCQCDKENNIWIADMRLGVIRVTPSGQFTQVCYSDTYKFRHIEQFSYMLVILSGLYIISFIF